MLRSRKSDRRTAASRPVSTGAQLRSSPSAAAVARGDERGECEIETRHAGERRHTHRRRIQVRQGYRGTDRCLTPVVVRARCESMALGVRSARVPFSACSKPPLDTDTDDSMASRTLNRQTQPHTTSLPPSCSHLCARCSECAGACGFTGGPVESAAAEATSCS